MGSFERFEVVETARRRRWTDDEKLKIVLESLQTPRSLIDSTTIRHLALAHVGLATIVWDADERYWTTSASLCAGDGDAGPTAGAASSFSGASERTHGDCRRQRLSPDRGRWR